MSGILDPNIMNSGYNASTYNMANPYIRLEPAVYYIKKLQDGSYGLEKVSDNFKLPNRIYGDNKKLAVRVWDNYVLNSKAGKSTGDGILLTGSSGTGKTLIGKIISNIAIANKMPVIVVTDIAVTIDVISFIAKQKDVVVFFDEFSKNVDNKLQDTSLTMFSDDLDSRKLFILTENDSNTVSRFIRDRPGRIKYHLDFERVSDKVVLEYCEEFNVSEKMFKEIMNKHIKSIHFSFDHLQAIVDEHIKHPNDELDYLIEILNVGTLGDTYDLILTEMYILINDEKISIPIKNNNYTISEKKFKKYNYSISGNIDKDALTKYLETVTNEDIKTSITHILNNMYNASFEISNLLEVHEDYMIIFDDSKRILGRIERI